MGVFLKKLSNLSKSMLGISVERELDYEEEEEMDVEEPKFETKATPRRNKIIPIGTNNNGRDTIGISIISSFNETQMITRELKARRPVIFSVDALDHAEARRVVDYVAGTVHGIDGDIKKIQEKSNIFVAVPSHISIETIVKNNEKMKEVVGVDIAL